VDRQRLRVAAHAAHLQIDDPAAPEIEGLSRSTHAADALVEADQGIQRALELSMVDQVVVLERLLDHLQAVPVQEAEVVAELALARGRPDDARAAVLAGLARETEDARYRAQLAATGVAAEAARPEPDDAALAHARDLMARLDGIDTKQLILAVAETATARAEFARFGTPDPALWREAASAWEARPAPYQVAYCRWREGEALLATGAPRAAAAAALRTGAQIARDLGAQGVLREIELLAARARIDLAGAAAPEPAASDPHGLTPREREILAYLAAGRTNREIGEALFISPRTAGVHVSRILAKLGASTRGEAAAAGRLAGVIDEAELARLVRRSAG